VTGEAGFGGRGASNVIALCPTCQRGVHHGLIGEMLKATFISLLEKSEPNGA
jgi:hypothetical protein